MIVGFVSCDSLSLSLSVDPRSSTDTRKGVDPVPCCPGIEAQAQPSICKCQMQIWVELSNRNLKLTDYPQWGLSTRHTVRTGVSMWFN